MIRETVQWDTHVEAIKANIEQAHELVDKAERLEASGNYNDLLKNLELLRLVLGEHLHEVAQQVATTGTNPVESLRAMDTEYAIPRDNHFIPPFVPPSYPGAYGTWEEVAHESFAGLSEDELKEKREEYEEERARAVATWQKEKAENLDAMSREAVRNLFWWPGFETLRNSENSVRLLLDAYGAEKAMRKRSDIEAIEEAYE